jgi:hypothetical protein
MVRRWPLPAGSPSPGTPPPVASVAVPEHLAADAEVPVLTGLQAQGDLLVVPVPAPRGARWEPLPAGGHQLVRGEATGNTHWLHQGFDSPGVRWADAVDGVRLGFLRVPPGQSALLLHTDEHGANGIGPGTYAVHASASTSPRSAWRPSSSGPRAWSRTDRVAGPGQYS